MCIRDRHKPCPSLPRRSFFIGNTRPVFKHIEPVVQSNISPARMIQPIAGLPQPSRMRQVILLGIVPASCFEHSLLSKLRLALFGKRVRIIPLTNTNFIISCGGGFDEPRKYFKPSHTPPHTSRASLPRASRLKHAQFCVAW